MPNFGKSSKIKDFLKSKFRQKNQNNESFIIKYNENNKNIIASAELLDQRRLVFVSLFGLYRTWKNVPSVQLNSALILLPLKKRWLHDPLKYNTEISRFMNAFKDMVQNEEFVQFLKWKDFQGLVFWMSDEFEHQTNKKDCKSKPVNAEFTAPFWIYLSDRLVTLFDPITGDKYKPLKVNENWWKKLNIKKLKFSNSISFVLHELFFVTMKYKQIQEIIYQSYPKSLNPITSFDRKINSLNGGVNSQYNHLNDNLSMFIHTDPNWHILDHYNPYYLD